MLKQRLITAAILIPLVVWAILALPVAYIAVIFGGLLLIGAWEWSRLSNMHSTIARITYIAVVGILMYLCWTFPEKEMLLHYMMKAALAWWLLCLLWLFNIKFASVNNAKNNAIKLFSGIMLLIPSWYALISLHGHLTYGPYWALFIMALAWVADSGAYFSGKKFGKNKLAPHISPGKTREGVYGGLLFVTIYALLFGWLLDLKGVVLIEFCIIGLVVAVFSVVGDLFVSVMKRQANIKDSGNIFPGHGGVMDRVDSLTAALPLFLFGLTWMHITP